jgi:hypothetical protein
MEATASYYVIYPQNTWIKNSINDWKVFKSFTFTHSSPASVADFRSAGERILRLLSRDQPKVSLPRKRGQSLKSILRKLAPVQTLTPYFCMTSTTVILTNSM